MFTKNVGRTDRIIRAIIGVVLLIVFFSLAAGVWKWLALIVGLVLLVSAALGTCPPYSLLGINTCKMKENQS